MRRGVIRATASFNGPLSAQLSFENQNHLVGFAERPRWKYHLVKPLSVAAFPVQRSFKVGNRAGAEQSKPLLVKRNRLVFVFRHSPLLSCG